MRYVRFCMCLKFFFRLCLTFRVKYTLIDVSHSSSGDFCVGEFALVLGIGGAVLPSEKVLTVLVKVELSDHAVRRVDWDVHGCACEWKYMR